MVYMHINDLCNLLKEDVINKKKAFKKGLVFKQVGINSSFMGSNGSGGNDVETFKWRSNLDMKRVDEELISPAVVEENLPNFMEYI